MTEEKTLAQNIVDTFTVSALTGLALGGFYKVAVNDPDHAKLKSFGISAAISMVTPWISEYVVQPSIRYAANYFRKDTSTENDAKFSAKVDKICDTVDRILDTSAGCYMIAKGLETFSNGKYTDVDTQFDQVAGGATDAIKGIYTETKSVIDILGATLIPSLVIGAVPGITSGISSGNIGGIASGVQSSVGKMLSIKGTNYLLGEYMPESVKDGNYDGLIKALIRRSVGSGVECIQKGVTDDNKAMVKIFADNLSNELMYEATDTTYAKGMFAKAHALSLAEEIILVENLYYYVGKSIDKSIDSMFSNEFDLTDMLAAHGVVSSAAEL